MLTSEQPSILQQIKFRSLQCKNFPPINSCEIPTLTNSYRTFALQFHGGKKIQKRVVKMDIVSLKIFTW